MRKLKEVKMPPLDGTEFVVVWADSEYGVWSGCYKVVDNVIHEFCPIEGGFMSYGDKYDWESDITARYFVATK